MKKKKDKDALHPEANGSPAAITKTTTTMVPLPDDDRKKINNDTCAHPLIPCSVSDRIPPGQAKEGEKGLAIVFVCVHCLVILSHCRCDGGGNFGVAVY